MGRNRKFTVKQHYVPACYLARFTLEGERSSAFHVHSVDGSPIRESTPNAEGCENHYHTIDVPGLDPDYFEGFFGKYEAPACSLFKALSENPGRLLDSRSDLDTVAMFFAVQAARLPQSKERFEKWVRTDTIEFMNKLSCSDEFRQKVETKTGITIGREERESLRKAVEAGAIKFNADRNHIIFGMLNLVEAFLETIDGMSWTLLYCHGPDWFICSDHPVGVFYKLSGSVHDRQGAGWTPTIELATNMHHLYLPLAHNVALVLHREDYGKGAMWADQRMIGVVNCLTVVNAKRFVFSLGPDFICGLPGGRLGNAKETIETLQRRTTVNGL